MAGGAGEQGGEMTQTMYVHVNKWITKKITNDYWKATNVGSIFLKSAFFLNYIRFNGDFILLKTRSET
jgi:hypothetical protein